MVKEALTPPPIVEETPSGGVAVTRQLKQSFIQGFTGSVIGGVVLIPGNQRVLVLGPSLHVQSNGESRIITGHNYPISCLESSPSGRYLATGEDGTMGVKAKTILWDTESWTQVGCHQTHHASVRAIAISPAESIMVSLGAEDDMNLVVWNIVDWRPICSSRIGNGRSGPGKCLAFVYEDYFVCGGKDFIQTWNLKEDKLFAATCNVGKLKRTFQCVAVDPDSDTAYFGTDSGDLVKVALLTGTARAPAVVSVSIKKSNKKSAINAGRFSGGINSLKLLDSSKILIGCGLGELSLVQQAPQKVVHGKNMPMTQVCESAQGNLEEKYSHKFGAAITSINFTPVLNQMLIATSGNELLNVNLLSFGVTKELSCCNGPLNSVAYPVSSHKVYSTAGNGGVRIWSYENIGQPLVKINPPHTNITATKVIIGKDGRFVVTGWSDGAVRFYTPETGNLVMEVRSACSGTGGVTSMALNRDYLIVGGSDGGVKLWSLGRTTVKLLTSVREHRGKVTYISLSPDNQFLVTAGEEGAALVWSLPGLTRINLLRGTASLISAFLHPNGVHGLIAGTDKELGYWDLTTGLEIRHLKAPVAGEVTCVELSPNGETIAVGTKQSVIRLIRYRDGANVGVGHVGCGSITAMAWSGDSNHLIVTTNYAIIVGWVIA